MKKGNIKRIDRWLLSLYVIILYLTYEINRLIEGNFFK